METTSCLLNLWRRCLRRVLLGPLVVAPLLAGAVLGGGIARGESLAGRIDGLLGNPQLRGAQVSISIARLTPTGAKEVYAFHPDLPLMPASNTKLLTTSDAFIKMGAHASLKTRLYRVGNNLVIVGGGDPALGDAALCARVHWTSTTIFQRWAAHLKAMGLTNFRHVLVDDSIFDHHFVAPGWPTSGGQRLAWYEGPVGGLNFNINCLDWRPTVAHNGAIGVQLNPRVSDATVKILAHRGPYQRVWMWRPPTSNHFIMRGMVHQTQLYPVSTSIVDPGLWTGSILKGCMEAGGVHISGPVQRETLAQATAASGMKPQLLATFATPLSDILHRADTDSINMMAECLCKKLGHDATGRPGSWANGTAAVINFVKSLGLPSNTLHLVDGSGLSRQDVVASRVFTTVLADDYHQPDAGVFIHSLAVPGRGTLINRFVRSPMDRFIHAKTGHIDGASTLTGFLLLPHQPIVFSILVNHYHGNVNYWQEQVVHAVYLWAGH